MTVERTAHGNGFCRACDYVFAHDAAVTFSQAELARIHAEREELIDALEEYGAHDLDDCGGDGEGERCTCGLDDLLARLRGEATVRPVDK